MCRWLLEGKLTNQRPVAFETDHQHTAKLGNRHANTRLRHIRPTSTSHDSHLSDSIHSNAQALLLPQILIRSTYVGPNHVKMSPTAWVIRGSRPLTMQYKPCEAPITAISLHFFHLH
jgi:hypothetical protein